MGGLRLDSRAALLKGGNSGPAIVAGDPDKSLLVIAVKQSRPDLKMPKGGKLTPDQIEGLALWVKAGAIWPETSTLPVARTASDGFSIQPEQRGFWSFQPLRKPPTPVNADPRAKTDIDRFVLARLEKAGIQPVPPADPRTLLRRASLDLTGLPPTPEELDSFQKDNSADAFAKVVDRLLASPHYGERWGRMWLDVARYGEDDYRSLAEMKRGYEAYPNAYLYRDWVIQAFNDDLPFDVFVKAQLAADLMEEKSRARLLPALGFLGLGPWYYDNGAAEITRADERHDKVDVVSRGFLGLTVACARCHDHKYDPISTKDYYALAGVFVNTVYHEYPQVPKSVVEETKQREKRIEQREKLLADFLSTESTQLGESLSLQASKYMLAAWKISGEPKEDVAKVIDESKVDPELLERWIKFLAKPPRFYPYLKDWQELIKRGGTADEAKKLADQFQATLVDVMFARKDIKEENEIITAKALLGTKKKKPGKLPSDFVTNEDFCPGCNLELKSLKSDQNNLWTDVFARDLGEGFDPAQTSERIKPGLLAFRGWSLERRLSADRRAYLQVLRDDIDVLKKSGPSTFPFVHGVADDSKPVNLKVSLRGNPYNLGAEVPRRFPAILSNGDPQAFTNGSGRLQLAEAIVEQPITARVIVNRVWKQHFGTGLVDSPSNFGVAGERPSNPELLEYLALWFIENGRSIKKLNREIMLSSVYLLGNGSSNAGAEKDAGNRLYWRANRHRMDAEEIRDSLLSISGDLDPKLGGPSGDLNPSYKRRTVYGKVSRYKLDDYLQLFDFPSPGISAEKRFATTVPLQRLFLMNSDFVQQQAELAVRRVTADQDDTRTRILKLYRFIFGREPSAAELAGGLDYLKAEPMRGYRERSVANEKATKENGSAEAEPAPKPESVENLEGISGEGMMAGMIPGVKANPPEKLLPVTVLGRYAKVLLSSGEFLFVD